MFDRPAGACVTKSAGNVANTLSAIGLRRHSASTRGDSHPCTVLCALEYRGLAGAGHGPGTDLPRRLDTGARQVETTETICMKFIDINYLYF